MKYFLIIFLIPFISCINSDQKDEKEIWKTEDYINEKQILLTNEYEFSESYSYGASSFLIASKNNVPLICTVKHLLGEAMGILPEISTKDFNQELIYWTVYPRDNKLSDDELSVTGIVSEEINTDDIILLEYEAPDSSNLLVLKPRFTKIKKGEKLEIIGCEYSDLSCHQKKYDAVMDEYDTDGMLIIKALEAFDMSGFSGAPVIDENGLAIGVVSAGGDFDGEYFLWIEPLSKVKQYLE